MNTGLRRWLDDPLIQVCMESHHELYAVLGILGDSLSLLSASKAYRQTIGFSTDVRLLSERYGQSVLDEMGAALRNGDGWLANVRTPEGWRLLELWICGRFAVLKEQASGDGHSESPHPLNEGSIGQAGSSVLSHDILIALNSKLKVLSASESLGVLFGKPVDQLIGMSIEALIFHRDYAHLQTLLQQARINLIPVRGEARLRPVSGEPTPYRWTIAFHGDNPLLIGRFAERDLETELVLSEERLNLILESIEDAFFSVDRQWHINYVNQRGADLLGKPPSSLQGKRLWDCAPALLQSDAFLQFNRAVSSQKPVVFQMKLGASDHWYQTKACPNAEGISVFFTDITSLKRTEESIRHQALHDSLTGLPNRLFLTQQLDHHIHQAASNDSRVGLLFVDLDGFKSINDTLGHDAGDELLKQVAKRMKDCVRKSDIVARLSGDEFIIALNQIQSPEQAFDIGRKVVDALSATPFPFGKDKMHVGASIGLAMYPDDALNTETLLKHADMAMYDAKQAGKNTVRMYQQHMSSELRQRLELEEQLRTALAQDGVLLEYQPRFSADGRLLGMEALARIRDDETQRIIWPSQFIPVAEETGLINSLGEKVLLLACHQVANWNQQFKSHLRISVNVSGLQIRAGRFDEIIDDVLKQTRMMQHLLEIELTETTLMDGDEPALKLLQRIRDKGIKIAVDDFGTGYSSLAALQKLPVSVLKLDRSFVAGIPGQKDAVAISKAILAMAHALELETVAEGVETQAQMSFLQALGVEQLQGFYLGKPMSAPLMERFIEQHMLMKHTIG